MSLAGSVCIINSIAKSRFVSTHCIDKVRRLTTLHLKLWLTLHTIYIYRLAFFSREIWFIDCSVLRTATSAKDNVIFLCTSKLLFGLQVPSVICNSNQGLDPLWISNFDAELRGTKTGAHCNTRVAVSHN